MRLWNFGSPKTTTTTHHPAPHTTTTTHKPAPVTLTTTKTIPPLVKPTKDLLVYRTLSQLRLDHAKGISWSSVGATAMIVLIQRGDGFDLFTEHATFDAVKALVAEAVNLAWPVPIYVSAWCSDEIRSWNEPFHSMLAQPDETGRWDLIYGNAVLLSRAANDNKCKGILLDAEDEGGVTHGHAYPESDKQAERGRDLATALSVGGLPIGQYAPQYWHMKFPGYLPFWKGFFMKAGAGSMILGESGDNGFRAGSDKAFPMEQQATYLKNMVAASRALLCNQFRAYNAQIPPYVRRQRIASQDGLWFFPSTEVSMDYEGLKRTIAESA